MLTLAEYIDSEDAAATETVWGYVPLRRIAEVLASHGGLLLEGHRVQGEPA
jgi:hypothetical protein